MDKAVSLWNAWNSSGTPKYPHMKLIQFMFRNYPVSVRKDTIVLDLGCGSGVNTKFLSQEGFSVYVTDISPVGVANTLTMIEQNGLRVEDYRVESISQLSYPKNFFDCIVSIGVMESAGIDEARKCAPLIHHTLKTGGKAFLVFAAHDDFRMENNTFSLYGYNEDEVRSVFKDAFTSVLVDHYITTFENQTRKQHDFIVTLVK